MNGNILVTAANDIRRALSEQQLCLMLGAGVTAAASGGNPFGSWQSLVTDAVNRCLMVGSRDHAWAERAKADIASPHNSDLIAAAEKATDGLGGRHNPEFRRWLRETVGSIPNIDHELTDVIAQLAERRALVATTNYDSILEHALGLPVVTWRDSSTIQRVYRDKDAKSVIHLHGHWREPESVVFGSSSYADILNDPQAAEFLRITFWTKTVVFCGFGAGIQDPNFAALRRWLRTYRGSEYYHYRLVRTSEVQQAISEHDPDEHIRIIPFGAKHEELPRFLHELTGAGSPLRAASDPQTDIDPYNAANADAASVAIEDPAATTETRESLQSLVENINTAVHIAGNSAPDLAHGDDHEAYVRFGRTFNNEIMLLNENSRAQNLTMADASKLIVSARRLIQILNHETLPNLNE
ncbi:SIR2 family NAD-dependent protein deacylase [Mycobacteroides abscessus]|uniref:SIR2 family NAD-dependent protein deacylase n=1 Tax=Mycobacteroides abscessus TaxID=36809 RepID=UPI00092AAEAE|nr:SIR2 family protein [Mycobacteroides abscessus]SHX64928.1 Uncharacterised protein [Mycobacteroides abscessus subsp. abscessus]SHY15992.1 Uncharacterised protein [Mycobacteroides abscessus subsp. abscessus]SIB55096.1 Uncharacterised protein [Mycobacteroides abscessus subsp. abscessus]SIB94582.1 Uncharacterised protein [Mycobacteroides abscessus subsp. abscessus]SIC80878.1 Uncharacterised protein [Mycobacteroides abscessus subsp. abscessus]